MKKPVKKNSGGLTKESRQRILDVAEELFAKKGFDGTSVRDLTTKAKSNLSSVNYHFGDKQELYEEIFRKRLREMRDSRLEAIRQVMDGKNKPTLEKLLCAYAEAFLEPFGDMEQSQRLLNLFSRELVDQRLPKNMFFNEMAGPVMDAFEDALVTVCHGLGRREAQMSDNSLIAQLVHVIQVSAMLGNAQNRVFTSSNLDKVIDHIVSFSAAGIRACAKGSRK